MLNIFILYVRVNIYIIYYKCLCDEVGKLNLYYHLNKIMLHDHFLIRKDQYIENNFIHLDISKQGILISPCAYDDLLAKI